LLVTQEQAEKLVLAEQRGRIQLVLRNGLDDEVTDGADPVASADLGIDEPRKPQPIVQIRQAPPAAAPPPPPPSPRKEEKKEPADRVIRIFRGDKVTEEKIQ
jgi:Flp pilus assembly protein CpaB